MPVAEKSAQEFENKGDRSEVRWNVERPGDAFGMQTAHLNVGTFERSASDAIGRVELGKHEPE
jgi:hypothetical protein